MSDFVIDHVQIAIPVGGEELGRLFFGDLLGLDEIPKPAAMQGRGGCWFDLGTGVQLHLGAEAGFRPARKAHVALATSRLDLIRKRLSDSGHETHDDMPIDGRARFFTFDPFGNRIEFLERAS
jgi:hypothetical protein